MITDEEIIGLGFRKIKSYKKKKEGISAFIWELDGFELTIEQNLGADDSETFKPTLRVGCRIFTFNEIEEIEKLLKALWITKEY
jgi:hypothetical protein